MKLLRNDEYTAILGKVDELTERAGSYEELHTLVEAYMNDIVGTLDSLTWRTIGQGTNLATQEMAIEERTQLLKIARDYWLKDPLLHQAVSLTTLFTFGEGMRYGADEDGMRALAETFWLDEDNQLELTSYAAQEQKSAELQVDGEIFFVLFPMPDGRVKVRTLPPEEITQVISSPDDQRRALYYQRKYQPLRFNFKEGAWQHDQDLRTEYYADWHNYAIGQWGFETGMGPVKPGVIFHVAVNKIGWQRRGNTELYAALDWVKAHRQMLQDWVTIVKAYTTLAWKAKVKGDDARDIQRIRQKLTGLFPQFQAQPGQPIAPSGVGGVAIENDDVTMQPIKTAGMTTSPADARNIRLQVSAATGIMDHYFGDAGNANLATAEAMELPMLKKFAARQRLWEDIYGQILQYVVINAAETGHVSGASVIADADDQGRVVSKRLDGPDGVSPVYVKAPPILTANIQSLGQGLGELVTAGALSPYEGARYALRVLDIPKGEEILADMYPDGETSGRQAVAQADPNLQAQLRADAAASKARPPIGGGGDQPPPDGQAAGQTAQ